MKKNNLITLIAIIKIILKKMKKNNLITLIAIIKIILKIKILNHYI